MCSIANNYWINTNSEWTTFFVGRFLACRDGGTRETMNKLLHNYMCHPSSSLCQPHHSFSQSPVSHTRRACQHLFAFWYENSMRFVFRMWRTGISDFRVTCNRRLCKHRTPQGESHTRAYAVIVFDKLVCTSIILASDRKWAKPKCISCSTRTSGNSVHNINTFRSASTCFIQWRKFPRNLGHNQLKSNKKFDSKTLSVDFQNIMIRIWQTERAKVLIKMCSRHLHRSQNIDYSEARDMARLGHSPIAIHMHQNDTRRNVVVKMHVNSMRRSVP